MPISFFPPGTSDAPITVFQSIPVDLNSLSFGFNMPNWDGGIQATYENYLVRSLPPQ